MNFEEAKSVLSRKIVKPLIASKRIDYRNKKSTRAKNQKYIFYNFKLLKKL